MTKKISLVSLATGQVVETFEYTGRVEVKRSQDGVLLIEDAISSGGRVDHTNRLAYVMVSSHFPVYIREFRPEDAAGTNAVADAVEKFRNIVEGYRREQEKTGKIVDIPTPSDVSFPSQPSVPDATGDDGEIPKYNEEAGSFRVRGV